MSSPLRPLGGPYIFHLVWHLFDFVSAGDAVSCPQEKKAWKINHAHFLKVSYPISQTCKLEATSQKKTVFCNWHAGYGFLCLFGQAISLRLLFNLFLFCWLSFCFLALCCDRCVLFLVKHVWCRQVKAQWHPAFYFFRCKGDKFTLYVIVRSYKPIQV